MIIGGVQEPGRVNNLKLLFYKTENYQTPNRDGRYKGNGGI